MFVGSQVNLYADDVETIVDFYKSLGFVETYRYAPQGEAWHVEVKGAGLVLGVASPKAALADHGLRVSQDGAAMELVLWCEDVDTAYALALRAGATAMREPHDFQDGRLRVGWVGDPAGNPLELVQRKG
jgi:predicted enzyme related to lactoylglutathione lyase